MKAKLIFRKLDWTHLTHGCKAMPPEEGFLVTRCIPKGSEIVLHDGSRFTLATDVAPETHYGCEIKYVRVLERDEGVLISNIDHLIFV